jgi:hypothetical protein
MEPLASTPWPNQVTSFSSFVAESFLDVENITWWCGVELPLTFLAEAWKTMGQAVGAESV